MNNTALEYKIREFEPGDEVAFRLLNEEWITREFVLEPKDVYFFSNPQATILDHGGRIFFAIQNGETVGCCALVAISPGEFEVAKMAVTRACQGTGIGRRLLHTVVDEAKASGATRLYLETNHKLTPAIHLYEAIGFKRVPPDRVVPSPYARAEVPMELSFPTP